MADAEKENEVSVADAVNGERLANSVTKMAVSTVCFEHCNVCFTL